MASSNSKKLILVIGATGAQGIAVIDALLVPSADGTPSPYAVRALTRDPTHRRAKELAAKGVEIVKGAVEDEQAVLAALQGAYGAFVNTDSFTIGEQKEIFYGIRIFELAKQARTVRQYVWSSLDYVSKLSGYNPKYRSEHHDGKGRVAEFLKAQPSVVSDDEMSWSCISTGPYMETLKTPMFGPLIRRDDGTYVFAAPLGDGHVPLVSLRDIGFFARYSYDRRAAVSGRDLAIASELATLDDIVGAFRRATGHAAVVVRQSVEEWFGNLTNVDRPVASERAYGDGSTTFRQNFTAFWYLFRDDIVKRDMEWIRRVNPGRDTLESWMRENEFAGELARDWKLLKGAEDSDKAESPLNVEHIARTLGKA